LKKGKRMKKFKNRNYHHLIPQSRGGIYAINNLLLIDIERHKIWHKLFGNRTLGEVIQLLIRLERMKGGCYG
jgi:hypothetical protein